MTWDRWQQGGKTHAIARLIDRGPSSIQGIFAETGGIRLPARKRSPLSLSITEREEISRGIVAGQSVRWIAELLVRAPSTASREINCNGGRRVYRANKTEPSGRKTIPDASE